jgi:hypothetical protein
MNSRRFPPPWSVEELAETFCVTDANGQALGFFYFDDEPSRRAVNKRLTRGAAHGGQFRQAAGVIKRPSDG